MLAKIKKYFNDQVRNYIYGVNGAPIKSMGLDDNLLSYEKEIVYFVLTVIAVHLLFFIRNWSIRNWGSDFGISIALSFLNPTFYS